VATRHARRSRLGSAGNSDWRRTAAPRQIIDLLDWYEGQLRKLQVAVKLNAPVDATSEGDRRRRSRARRGSQPRAPVISAPADRDRMPGVERGNAWSVET